MRICRHCGAEFISDYTFCPTCGSALTETDLDHNKIQPEKKPVDKKKKSIIVGCILAVIVIAGILFAITSPKELQLNNGNPIEIYVNDVADVSVYGDGLSEADYQAIVWTTDNGDVLTVNDGKIKGLYSSDSFNEISEEGEEDMDPCSCTTYVRATIDKGIKKWEGSAEVTISLEPVSVKSGTIIKEPAGARISSFKVTAAESYNTYIYLKSTTKKSNDMSFIVKKGETTTVYVPADTYNIYYANGDTWYGGKYTFGPQTTYRKDSKSLDFYTYTWTLELESTNGNTTSEEIDEESFPGL